jgi:hypothetical protein
MFFDIFAALLAWGVAASWIVSGIGSAGGARHQCPKAGRNAAYKKP